MKEKKSKVKRNLFLGVFAGLLVLAMLIAVPRFFPKMAKYLPDIRFSNSGSGKKIPSQIKNNTNEKNTILEETSPADQSYIDETLFLGDSNTVRFLYYTDENGKPFTTEQNTIAAVSMGIEHIQSLALMRFSTGNYTIPVSVSIMQPRRIIIAYGTNNFSYGAAGAEAFANDYAQQIKVIEAAYPYADIIVSSVPPVTANTIFKNATMDIIINFNRAIQKMCKDNGWKYLNTFEVLYDSNTGHGIKEMFFADGLHLSQKGIATIFEYIKTHALYSKDRRPTPLQAVPQIYGPLTEILTPIPVDVPAGN